MIQLHLIPTLPKLQVIKLFDAFYDAKKTAHLNLHKYLSKNLPINTLSTDFYHNY
jgi:hypothetical protein